MAAFGAQYPCFAPFAAPEQDSAMPTYKDGMVIGELVSANISVTTADGEIWGDDKKIESISEFASAECPMETVDMEDAVAAVIYNAEVANSEVHFKPGAEPPYGGLAYFKSLMRKGKKYYKCYFYPKAQAALGDDNAQTKGSSITLQSTTTKFKIMAPLFDDGSWRIWHVADSVADAKAWIRSKLDMQ